MLNRIIYKSFIAIVILSSLRGQTVGFGDVGGNYYKAYAESSSGTIDIDISGTSGGAFTATFFIHADYTTNVSTAKRANSWTTTGYGQGYWLDFGTSLTWTSSDYTVNNVNVSTILTNSASGLNWRMTLIGTGDGTWTFQLPVYDDVRYEGGSSAYESLHLDLEAIGSTSINGSASAFEYRITDNDLVPYYGFENTSDQTLSEGTSSDAANNFRIKALPNPSDNVTYVCGHNPIIITWTITHGTGSDPTVDADFSSLTGTETINEVYGGSGNPTGLTTGYLEHDEINITPVDDNIDEPDSEYWTITLSETDDDGELLGSNASLDCIITDDPEDQPPYVQFAAVSKVVEEGDLGTDIAVTIECELRAASGFDGPSIPYEITGGTATATGDYQDHTLENGTLTFGAAGDTEQNIEFSIKGDNYDEGLNTDAAAEYIDIAFNGTNASNAQVNAAEHQTTFRFYIKDNDDTPKLQFADNTTEGEEEVQEPEILVIVGDASGNQTPSALPITLSIANDASGTATIYSDATTPYDYQINGTTGSVTDVTIPAYTATYAIPLTINNDAYYEGGSETVKFNVITGNNATGGTFPHTYTITDDAGSQAAGTKDEKPVLSFTNGASTVTSTETGSSDITGSVDVQLSAPTALPVNFTYSITSYNAGSGAAAYGSNSVDDDGDGLSDVDDSGEGDAAGTDFSLPATSGTIAAVTNVNETTASTTISFTHHVDKTDELDKYVELTLALAGGESDATLGTGGAETQIIKLQDDDAPMQLSFNAATDTDNNEGTSENITVYKLTDSTTPAQDNGTTDTEFVMKATIAIGSSNNQATDGGDYDDFDLTTSDGTAIAPAASQVLTFGTGDNSQSIAIALDDDPLYEGGTSGTPEDIKFELGTLVFASEGANPNMTYQIVDVDEKPVISFDNINSESSGDETNESRPDIIVKQDIKSIYASTIDYTALPSYGTAEADDYTLQSGTVQIDALSLTKNIDLVITSDTKWEEDETVIIHLDNSTVSSQTTASGSNMTHTYTIENDSDTKPTLNFSASSGSATASNPEEADATETITVSLSAMSGVASSVTYTITGTAVEGTDFTDATTDYDSDPNTNVITWSEDDAAWAGKTIVINFTDDVIDEGDETIIITLSGVSGGAQNGSDLVHTITLQDSDIPPVMQFTSSTMSVDEDDGSITVPLTLTHDGSTKQASDAGDAELTWTINTSSSTVDVHASNTSYPNDITSASSGQVTIAKGQTDGSITFTLNDDAIDEWAEDFVIDLSSPNSFATASGNQSITVTINDGSDTAPTVNFNTTAGGSGTTETNSANATINFTDYISLTGKSGKDLWFSYVTEGAGAGTADPNQDYTPLDGTFKIAAGSLTPPSDIPLVILPDEIDELDEQTVKITLAVLGADQNDDQSTYEGNTAAESAIDGSMVFTYTIDDDDLVPNAFFKNVDGTTSSEAGSIYEDDANGKKTIIVALSAASERNVTLYYSDAGTGTATSGSDYPAISDYEQITTISGATGGGATEGSFDITITDDVIHEEDQTIIITLLSTSAADANMGTVSYASAGGGSDAESVDSYILTIMNDEDPPRASFTDGTADPYVVSATNTVAENAGSITINVELTIPTEKTVTIPFTFSNHATIPATGANSTAAYPTDFYYSGFTGGGSLTINGDGSDLTPGATFDISILADAIDEWDEKIIIDIGTPTNAEPGDQTKHTVTITDVSDPPTINFTTLTVDDGTTETVSAGTDYNLKSIIALSTESGRDLQFTYDTKADPGTADAGFDYTEIDAATFTIAAGQTQTADDMIISLFPDDWDEDDKETIKVTIALVGADQDGDGDYSDATGASVVTDGEMVFIYNVNDDDPVPNAYFKNVDTVTDSETGSVEEDATKTITVALSQASERNITLYYSDAGTGDATSGADYTAINAYNAISTITGAPGGGPTEATFTVTTLPDDIDEGVPPNDYQTVDINLLSTVAATSEMPTASNALVSSSNSGAEAVVSYTLQITDLEDALPLVNFTDGSDAVSDANSVPENGGTITINVELSTATERTITIPFTFSSHASVPATGANSTGDYPTDFFYSGFTGGGTLTINGDGSDDGPKATFDISILADAIDEWDEKIVINLGDPTNAQKGGTAQHTVTITDASAAPSIDFTTFSIDNGTAELAQSNADYNLKDIIALSSESGKDITFTVKTNVANNGATATAAQDYTELDGTFTLTAGQTAPASDIILDILDDSYDEVDKQTVVVNIGFLGADIEGDGTYDDPANDPAATNGSVTFTYNINDDEDSPVLIFSSATYDVDEDAGNTSIVKVKFDPTGTTLTERTVTGLLSVKNTSTANNGSDITTISDNTTLVISDGINGTTFPNLTVTDDDRWEVAEDVVLELGVYADASSNATIDGSNYITTVTIADDAADEPVIEFISSATGLALSEDDVNESDLTYNVNVGITNGKISEKEITIPYSINFSSSTAKFDVDGDGTQTAFPADYVKWGSSSTSNFTTTALSYTSPNVSASGTITILAGDGNTIAADQRTFFTVPINVDGIDENTEYLDFDLGTLTNASKGSNGNFRLTIEDHASDVPVKYSFATASAGTAPSESGAENDSPTFMVVLLDPNDQTQLKESGKEITLSWTIDLDGTNSDASKDVTEALDFNIPDFGNATTYTANLVFTPRTGSGTAAPTSLTIGTSDIDFDEADVTFESTEYFKLSLVSADDNAVVGSSDGATDEHYYGITNIDSRPVIFLTDSDNGVSIYEKSSQGANTHDFQFEVLSTGTKKSELPIYAYFKVSSTASGSDNDADISYTGTYEAGDLDYTYNSGPLDDNHSVVIAAPIIASSTGSITLAAYDDELYEQDEKLVLGMYTYSAAQSAASSLVSESYATSQDLSNADDTGFDEVEITIVKDPTDKPAVNFVNADGAEISTVSFREDTTGSKITVRVKASTTSSEEMKIPYSLTLDYDNDDKTARLGEQDNVYPYDYWIASTSEANFSITGDKSSNTVAADGWLLIPASSATETNLEATFDITINNDRIYEFDEKIILTLGTTSNATLTNASLGTSTQLTITIKNTGETAPVLTLKRAMTPDESATITSSSATVSSYSEEAIGGNEDDNDPHFEVKLVDATTGDDTEAGMDLKYSYNTASTTDATASSDYTETTAVGTISKGNSSSRFSIPILDDTIDEYDQVVKVTIAKIGYDGNGDDAASDAAAGDDSDALTDDISANLVHSYTILDDDDPPVVSFYVENGSNKVGNVETQTVVEKATGVAGTMDIVVRANSVSEKLITVSYSQLTSDSDCPSTGNCAESGQDFTALEDLTATPFTIAVGEQTNTFTITTLDDDRDEWDQDIVLELSVSGITDANATISSSEATGPPKYRLIVQDSDDEPSINFQSDLATYETTQTVTEGSAVSTNVYLSHLSEKTISIGYTIESTDAEFGIFTATPSDGSGEVTYPEDHAGVDDGSDVLTNSPPDNSTSGEEYLFEALSILIEDDIIDEWDEKFKIVLNSTDHASNPTQNAQIGNDAPSLIITISDNDALETVAFSTTSASDDENDVTNVVGADPGANSINIPIAIPKQSGKDIVLKYSIDHTINYPGASDLYYDSNYPNNENTATKGIDYSFGSSVTKNAAGDSITTITAGETTVYIPLTIVDDSFDEYDQKIRVSLSLVNSADWLDDASNVYYDSYGGTAGAEAELGSDYVYTFTITDNEPEPYVSFEADKAAVETNAGENSEIVVVNLIDENGNAIQSEKTITATFELDTDKGESETDYTSGSLNSDGSYDKYSDDFMFTNGGITFSSISYTYNSVSDAYTRADGDESKNITLVIYGDDLYEVDEYVNIELTALTNSNNSELADGDHSYVYTIENDDGMPSVTWLGSNPPTITEGDPETGSGEGDYQNNTIKVALSKESGTDILVEYSLVTDDAHKGTATAGIDNNFDINLGDDNPEFNTKTVIIPAATALATEWTVSVPIYVWDDPVVEYTEDADNENFKLQIDRYRDKGADDTWDNTGTTDDNFIVETPFSNMQEVTIIDNDTPPSEFDVGSVITKSTSTDPVVGSHWNPVTAGYWNSYNTGLAVTVPVENKSTLVGGNVRLNARVGEFAWSDLITPGILITDDELGTEVVFDVSAAEFEDADAVPAWYAEGNIVEISAIITDYYGNERQGNSSVTTITIDETAPAILDYEISSASASGGNEFDNYWNSTNTGLDVIVKTKKDPPDASVNNGSVRVLAGIGADASTADYYQLGDPVLIGTSNNNVNDSVSIAISQDDVIDQAEYDQGKTINLKAEIVDIAGNKKELNLATKENGGEIVIDTIHDSVNVTYSRIYVNGSHSPTITATYNVNDPPSSTPKISATYTGSDANDFTDASMVGSETDDYIFTYDLDVPGSNSTNPPESQYDGPATIIIDGTDMAGNPLLVDKINGKTDLIIDNTPPTILFTYATNNAVNPTINSGKGGDQVTVTASLSERMDLSPDPDPSNVNILPKLNVNPINGSGVDTNIVSDLNYTNYNPGTVADDDDIVTFDFTLPLPEDANFDGKFAEYSDSLVMTITGTDWAGNPVGGYISAENDSTNIQFKLDNQDPLLNSFNIDSVSFINSAQLGWTNSETLSSGWVKFVPVDAAQIPEVATEGSEIPFAGDELSAEQVILVGDISNNALLEAALGDSNLYNVTFRGIDLVGNVSDTTINSVTYDTLNPRLQTVVYETEFMTALTIPPTGTTVDVIFSELQNEADPPRIRFSFGAEFSQQDTSASYNGDVSLGVRDINLVKDNGNPKMWSGTLRADDVPALDTYDGFVWLEVTNSKDLAGNEFGVTQQNYVATSGDKFPVFTNILYLDNKEPTAKITYTNKRDAALTSYDSENADESYCCYAIHGDIVEVKVEMNEPIRYDAGNPPELKLYYNKDGNSALGFGDTVGDSVLSGNLPIVHEDDEYDANDSLGTVFHYEIEIPDGTNNHGTLTVELDAVDRSGTPIATYADSEQTEVVDSSSFVLEIDNIHPWGYPLYPIFDETVNLDSVTFPTDQFWTTGKRVVENWINSTTDSIYVRFPHHNPTIDPTLYGQSETLPQGKIDLQVKNLDLSPVKWQTVGSSDIITGGLAPFGVYSYLRTISRYIDDLVPGDMLNPGISQSNKMYFRAMITDRNGNITYGQRSDMYSINTETNLYEEDSINTDLVEYDITPPSGGDFNNGSFNVSEGSQIISSDSASISWTLFDDPGGEVASGIDMYEMQVYVYDEDPTGSDISDLSIVVDSLFTVDMDNDNENDVPGHWYKIYYEQAPSYEEPVVLNLLDSVVTDSASNINIQYDYNDTLKHNKYYRIAVTAYDVAGNPSDTTIATNAIQRINSAPIFVDNIADLILYEDIAWDYDTVKVTDLDLTTLQSDSFTYTIEPRKIETNDSGGNDTNLVLINPPVVDAVTGLVSWIPIQDSTLTPGGQDTIIDQSGEYILTFNVVDDYGFTATIDFNAIVNAVNDTPVVAILGEDKVISWQEDKPESEEVRINLSNYVKDIDNLDSELSWQFVIMDTSQLDEDFPLASVIVGPGTPKSVQTKLMKDYMGFDPARGIDLPRLARRAGATTMRMFSRASADSLITIDLDITENGTYAIFNSDSNYYGSGHRIIFIARDPFGASDKDTVIVNIIPENDPPVMAAIDTLVIDENDSIWIDFSQYTTDVDDSALTFTIEGIYNTDSVVFASEPYLSYGPGDTVLFNPFDLWSGHANFRVTASDEDAESSQLFTLNVMRVPRPDIEVSLVQNNAFSSYVHIIIIDKEQKTKYLQLEVQNQRIDVDTVAAYTYTGDFSFGIGGGYSFDILAIAEVGKTIYTNTFNLAPARVANRWYASSSDGNFSIAGDPGSVDMDQSFLIVDSSLFISSFTDEASYVLGDESFVFNKPIEVQFGSTREDLSIYQRDNGVFWKELPSINRNGQVLTFTENTGYFRLGPKTIIVPEETDLHQNYPNPFNPSTTIKYDIGLLDGLEQKISVNVYNVMGQHVTTLVNNVSQVGQFYVRWDGADKFGKMLPSGIYFVQLKTDTGIIKNKKMMFLK